MDKFQIVENKIQYNHAGTKAKADIAVIAERSGFQRLSVSIRSSKRGYLPKIQRQVGYWLDWSRCYREISEGSVVLLQHPYQYPQLTREITLRKLKKEKKVKYISIVHDVEELRATKFSNYNKREFETMLELADVIVVHNEVMKRYFIEKGVEEDKLVNLEIFDYLQECRDNTINFRKSITVAGNLDVSKCQYIFQLGELKETSIDLFGPNFSAEMEGLSNVFYHGSFPVDEIPMKLNEGFGLVWDGESIDGCKGVSGQYLRFNNPHKLSLYLSSGMPVVIWNEAAEAEFVKKYGVGICVGSLRELEQIFAELDYTDFSLMRDNVNKVRPYLVKGYFTEKAIERALLIVSGRG